MEKLFRILDDRDGTSVMGEVPLPEGNVYIAGYGAILPGEKPIADLDVGESTYKKYALSGQKPTVYRILRVA
jgi:hypothetical protein